MPHNSRIAIAIALPIIYAVDSLLLIVHELGHYLPPAFGVGTAPSASASSASGKG
jgi:hypothetical protein